MRKRRSRGKHRGAATGPASPVAPPHRVARHESPAQWPPLKLLISRAPLSSRARRHMGPLIIVQFVINILLASLLNNQPQPQASLVGSSSSSSSSLSASLTSTWPSGSPPDSPDDSRTRQLEAPGVKFELLRGDKSSTSTSSVPFQTQLDLGRHARPHWRWLLANELEREVRPPDSGQRRHGNLLTIDDEDEEADYNRDNENSVRSRVVAVPEFRRELLARSMESELSIRPSEGLPSEDNADLNPRPPLAADLLKLKRRQRHHARQEHDLSGPASGSTSLTSHTAEIGGSGSAAEASPRPPPPRTQQIKTREQIQIAEQAYRNKLMELKQKYMTNRAINDLAYYVLLTIYASLITFGTISNSLICMTVILKPKILSPRNIFIVNLAGSDLLLCVFTMPFSFIEISMKMWQMGLVPCKLVSALQATSIFVSTISITAIALDRYKVIVYPTHQETASGARGACLLLASVWVGALLLSLPLFWFRTVENYDNLLPQNGSLAHHGLRSSSGQQQQQQQQHQQQQQQAAVGGIVTNPESSYHNNSGSAHQANVTTQPGQLRPAALNQHDTIESIDFCVEKWPFDHGRGIYSVISMIFQYVLPITIVGVVYTKISHKLQKRLIRRQRLTQLECQQKRQLNLIKRTHTMLISVSLVFGLSWLPLNLLNVISDFSPWFRQLLDDQSFRVIFAICHLIGCSSACSNPVLYGFLNENFRKELSQVYNYYARSLMGLLRRLIGCQCCWATRKLAQRCLGLRIELDIADEQQEEEKEEEDGARKQGANCEESELAIRFKSGDSLSSSHAHLHESNSSYSSSGSSSSSSGSGLSLPAFALPEIPNRTVLGLAAGTEVAISPSLNVRTSEHAHHSMRSLPDEISARALAGSTILACSRARGGDGEQRAVDMKVIGPEENTKGPPAAQRPSISQSMLDTARRLSYQTIASSRHTMGGRTMRLCLCISGSSSAETLAAGATTQPVTINGIKPINRMPGGLDSGAPGGAQLETRIDENQEEAARRRNRKLRRREKRRRQKEERAQLECQCQCHNTSSKHENLSTFDAKRQVTSYRKKNDDFESERYVDLASEMTTGARGQERQRTKFDSRSLDDDQTESPVPALGRRVWLRFLTGGGGGGGTGSAKSSCDLAISSRGRATDAVQVQGGNDQSTIDKNKKREDEQVKAAQVGHCNNCKHSGATSRGGGGGGVTSSTSLKRPASEIGEKRHNGKHHRDRAKRGSHSEKATTSSQAKQTQLGVLASIATAQQRDGGATPTKRRPLVSGLMSSLGLTRSAASSQDGASEQHQLPPKNSNASIVGDRFQLPVRGSSQSATALAANSLSRGRADKRQAEQKVSTTCAGGGGAGNQVGTVYLSIEISGRQRGDSFVSTSGRERSTSVVVFDYEQDRDDKGAGQETQPTNFKNKPPKKEDALKSNEQDAASREGKLEPSVVKESSSKTSISRSNKTKPTGSEAEDVQSQLVVRSSDPPSLSASPSPSASSSSSASSSFTSGCLLHSSSVFSSSCTCSTVSSCSQTTSTNCHLTVGASSCGPQLIAHSSGAASTRESTADGRREKKISQSHKRSPLASVTASQSGQDLKPQHMSAIVASTTYAASEVQVCSRARSATAGSDLSASTQAARASLIIGQGYGLRPKVTIAAPSNSNTIRDVPIAQVASSCPTYPVGVTTTGRLSLNSCCEMLPADEGGESRNNDEAYEDQQYTSCSEEGDRKSDALCNGHILGSTPPTSDYPTPDKVTNITKDCI